jgi:hypothetical protein
MDAFGLAEKETASVQSGTAAPEETQYHGKDKTTVVVVRGTSLMNSLFLPMSPRAVTGVTAFRVSINPKTKGQPQTKKNPISMVTGYRRVVSDMPSHSPTHHSSDQNSHGNVETSPGTSGKADALTNRSAGPEGIP